ncbi:MAG TPA: 4-hydroxy-3-methylbut-2-enyl diphosphate reductase [Candidatus Dormibacteraeota bacterium]|nr:4-hydroxy-3-methylbut-2-enyl diphosphate reductase [Candidatus Dormibacteraeota bacterium]
MTRILLANPRGFCAGVDRAIDIVEQLIDAHGAPLYVRREIVHNREVVENLRARGVIFVESIQEIPDGALAVFSAHGVSPAVQAEARERRLRIVDATCPLVSKVHLEALRFAKAGYFVLLVGHRNHDEVEGTLGHVPGGIALVEDVEQARSVVVPDETRVAVVTQTTLSLDDTTLILSALRERFPALREPSRSDICYATQNRQIAVKALAAEVDVVVVVGSENSSNSQRLRECAEQLGAAAYLVDGTEQLKGEWFAGHAKIGVTAGASSPETLVARIVERICELTENPNVEDFGEREPDLVFAPPKELALLQTSAGA